jgi:serine/threonine protein kinase
MLLLKFINLIKNGKKKKKQIISSKFSSLKRFCFFLIICFRHALRECDILKTLDHPRIVRLFDVFEIDTDS